MRIEGGIELMGIEVSLSWETIGGVEPRCGKCMVKQWGQKKNYFMLTLLMTDL